METMSLSLCHTCQHMHEVRTARSCFFLCQLSITYANYPKYPPQPVERCDGYLPAANSPQSLASGE
jgi:hypothetical protein